MQGGNRGKLIKQIMAASESHQQVKVTFQNYDISNRDILRTFQLHSFSRIKQGVKIIVYLSGCGAATYDLSFMKTFLSRGLEVLKFMSLRSYIRTYNLSYYWQLELDTY